MTAIEIHKGALQRPENERAELAAFLLESLEENDHSVDDDEVTRRSAELDSGEVTGLPREQFTRQCGH